MIDFIACVLEILPCMNFFLYAEHLDPINVKIAELREALESITAEQRFLKARDFQHRHSKLLLSSYPRDSQHRHSKLLLSSYPIVE